MKKHIELEKKKVEQIKRFKQLTGKQTLSKVINDALDYVKTKTDYNLFDFVAKPPVVYATQHKLQQKSNGNCARQYEEAVFIVPQINCCTIKHFSHNYTQRKEFTARTNDVQWSCRLYEHNNHPAGKKTGKQRIKNPAIDSFEKKSIKQQPQSDSKLPDAIYDPKPFCR